MNNIFKVNGKTSFGMLAVSIIISEGTGALSALAVGGAFNLNQQNIIQPSFAPPASVFGPVWTVLFFLMGLAAYRIWMYGYLNKGVKKAVLLYLVQLGLNFLWPILFFGLALRGLAMVEILVLLLFIILTTREFFRLDKLAGYLMFPYVLWVSFASILNYSIWMLNR